ncbi:HDOD domain-containing protein [Desulfovibrio sp. OttesenSCG-928-O18]|nr:HDOD domain-containing protein [Desulfovibrio sp. OttesenSCG-928-O18]
MLDRLKALMQEELLQNTQAARNDAAMSYQAVVARQPVFDLKGKIWGYELLYRRPRNLETADISSGAVATASVIINGYEMVRPGLSQSQKILINFTSDMIETQVIKLLPRDMCVVEILEDVDPTPEVIAAIADIKAAGYTVAVDDYVGQDNLQPFLAMADIIKVDVLGLDAAEIARHALSARGKKCLLLAEKVEDLKMAALCRQLGFSLFQGFFFSKPEVVVGKKVTTSQAVRMHILALCVGDDVDIKAVSEAVLHDPVITANFLKFVNSAHFGLRKRIRSVHHALAMVGPITFMQWLCVSVLATLENSPISHELAFLASQRAKFLESLGKHLDSRRLLPPGVSVSSLFLTGLFSLLESVMGMPLADALDGVPLEPEVVTALSGGVSLYTPWIKLMNHYERGEWDEAIPLARQLHLAESDLTEAYGKALEWSAVFFGKAGKEKAF